MTRTLPNGFMHQQNSCYADSVLYALLYHDSTWIVQTLLHSRQETRMTRLLKDCYASLHASEIHDLNSFRKKCQTLPTMQNGSYPPFFSDEAQDASEFCQFVFGEWAGFHSEPPIQCLRTQTETFYQEGSNICKRIQTDRELPIFAVTGTIEPDLISAHVKDALEELSVEALVQYGDVDETHGVQVVERGRTYSSVIRKRVIQSTPFLVVSLPRISMVSPSFQLVKKQTPVAISDRIALLGLYLFAFVVHIGSQHGGHYIAFVRRKNEWFLYDDVRADGPPMRIGTLEEVVSKTQDTLFDVTRNTTLLFYQRE